MSRRHEAALETRRKIIESMRQLLQEKNADTINIEDITASAGVAKGSFYSHFKRKEDVISVIAAESYNAIFERLKESEGDVYEQISTYLKKSAEIITGNTLQIAQNWIKSVSAPLEGENSGIEKYKFDYNNISEMLKKSVSNYELKSNTPVETITEIIMNNYYGAVANWCITRGEKALINSIAHFCDYGLHIILNSYKEKL